MKTHEQELAQAPPLAWEEAQFSVAGMLTTKEGSEDGEDIDSIQYKSFHTVPRKPGLRQFLQGALHGKSKILTEASTHPQSLSQHHPVLHHI